MGYELKWTSAGTQGIYGKSTIIVPNNLFDESSTSLVLTGQGVKGYGTPQLQNFMALLENFASNTAPAHPTIGQLWFNPVDSVLYLCVSLADTLLPTHYPAAGLGWIQINMPSLSGTVTSVAFTPANGVSGTVTNPTTTPELSLSFGDVIGTSFNGITGLSSSNPIMDGVATRGTSTLSSRQDHIHPSDSTKLSLSGGTMSGSINLPTGTSVKLADNPTAGTDAVNKNYVDSVIAGLSWKTSVKVATDNDITLAGAQTIDDVLVLPGDRVLVKAQSDSSQNGIYTVVSPGAWSRTTDMDDSTPINEFNGAATLVMAGTVYSGSSWTITSNVVSVGTSAIEWTQFSGNIGISPGAGISLVGNVLSVASSLPFVTSVGSLTSLTVTGPLSVGSILGNITGDVTGNLFGNASTATTATSATSATTAVNVTGVVGITNGGTNATSAEAALVSLGERTSTNGSLKVPVGDSTQRDASPAIGYLRFNTVLNKLEVWDGTLWNSVGVGATGGGTNAIFYENEQTVTASYSLPIGKNASSTGPLTIEVGVTVTIPDGATWAII